MKLYFLTILLFILLIFIAIPHLVRAQCAPTPTPGGTYRSSGFVSAFNITGFTTSLNKCIQGSDAVIPTDQNIIPPTPTYQNLKAVFFDNEIPPPTVKKVTVSGNATDTQISTELGSPTQNPLINITGDLTINSDITGQRTGVIFIDGNMRISQKIDYGAVNKTKGLVFIVNGDINIDDTVIQVNAFLVSFGTVCTAFDPTTLACPFGLVTTSAALTINGGLVSFNTTVNPAINFRRSLSVNNNPSENIVFDSRYLAILKDLFSEDLIYYTTN